MRRQQQRLSALQVSKLTKLGLYGDGGGLTLQITATGAKSWLFRFMVAGKPHDMGLGPTHSQLGRSQAASISGTKITARRHQSPDGPEARKNRSGIGERKDTLKAVHRALVPQAETTLSCSKNGAVSTLPIVVDMKLADNYRSK